MKFHQAMDKGIAMQKRKESKAKQNKKNSSQGSQSSKPLH
jgi:hypothetical protein